jgi:uncharacterized protein
LFLKEITIYPIKSLGGITLLQAVAQSRGLQFDRRWMLVDEQNVFITIREERNLVALETAFEANCLRVTDREQRRPPVEIPFDMDYFGRTEANIWSDTVQSLVACDSINEWFSFVIQKKCKLVYMPDDALRKLDPDHAAPGDIVSFADSYPFLLIGTKSMEELNSRLKKPIEVSRFRPNFVVETDRAFEEDEWSEFAIGNNLFRAVKPCARCVVPTIDIATGKSSSEPTRTLAGYRSANNNVYFGENCTLLEGNSQVRVNDRVEVISRKKPLFRPA